MRGLRVPLAAAVFVGSALAALSGWWPWRRPGVRPRLLVAAPLAPTSDPGPSFIETVDTLRRGQTASTLLARHGVIGLDFTRVTPRLLDPRRLRPGLVFSFRRVHRDSSPSEVRVRASPELLVTFARDPQGWRAAADTIPWRPELLRIEGAIDNSLYDAIDRQVADSQLGPAERVRLAWDLADVFAWQVDFTRDLQPGDRFSVAVERLVAPDGEVRLGRILASELAVDQKTLTAFRFEAAGRETFFDADGNSLRRAFLRAPVQFRRISSGFARARFHPVLGRWRRHEGTDYAAAPGTPVMAAGDGVVLRAGVVGGYGKLVELRHRNGITTRYGHLRGFARGIHPGARVTQGQVIGYVGSTGLATGPHLHYEFRVNGVARDSRRVNLGHGAPVPAALRARFERERDRLLPLLHPPAAVPAAGL